MQNARLLGIKAAGWAREVAIPGNRQRHQLRLGIRQKLDDGSEVVRRVIDQRADDTYLIATRPSFHDGEQPVLVGQHFAHLRAVQAHADHAPLGLAKTRQLIEMNRLMGPVKAADADVNDARCQRTAVIWGNVDLAGTRRTQGSVDQVNAWNGGQRNSRNSHAGVGTIHKHQARVALDAQRSRSHTAAIAKQTTQPCGRPHLQTDELTCERLGSV